MTLSKVSLKDSSSWYTLLNLIYPVGSIYISYTSTSPGTRFGGTWNAISDSRMWRPAGSWNSCAGSNFISVNNLPSHTHSYLMDISSNWYDGGGYRFMVRGDANSGYDRMTYNTNATGKGQEYWPLYRTCYCWYRTA